MKRDNLTRFGCDRCKLEVPTFHFDHYGDIELWFCEQCLIVLLDWPEKQS